MNVLNNMVPDSRKSLQVYNFDKRQKSYSDLQLGPYRVKQKAGRRKIISRETNTLFSTIGHIDTPVKKKDAHFFCRAHPHARRTRSGVASHEKGLEMNFLLKKQAHFSKHANHFSVFLSSYHPHSGYDALRFTLPQNIAVHQPFHTTLSSQTPINESLNLSTNLNTWKLQVLATPLLLSTAVRNIFGRGRWRSNLGLNIDVRFASHPHLPASDAWGWKKCEWPQKLYFPFRNSLENNTFNTLTPTSFISTSFNTSMDIDTVQPKARDSVQPTACVYIPREGFSLMSNLKRRSKTLRPGHYC